MLHIALRRLSRALRALQAGLSADYRRVLLVDGDKERFATDKEMQITMRRRIAGKEQRYDERLKQWIDD